MQSYKNSSSDSHTLAPADASSKTTHFQRFKYENIATPHKSDTTPRVLSPRYLLINGFYGARCGEGCYEGTVEPHGASYASVFSSDATQQCVKKCSQSRDSWMTGVHAHRFMVKMPRCFLGSFFFCRLLVFLTLQERYVLMKMELVRFYTAHFIPPGSDFEF